MRVIFETKHIVVTADSSISVVRYVRSSLAFESMQQLVQEHRDLGVQLDRTRRRSYGMLVDVREAPLNTSAEFERAIAEARKEILRGFPRIAVLVRTAVGSLQLTRHVREEGLDSPVLFDEKKAIEHVARNPDLSPPSSRNPISRY